MAEGALVIATIAASNYKGQGAFSSENTSGATVEVAPHSPSHLPRRGTANSSTQIQVDWDFFSSFARGRDPILSYKLQMDDGAGGAFTEVVGGET